MSVQVVPTSDPMGLVFLQQSNGVPEQEIEERSDGFVNVGPGGNYYVADYSEWLPHEQQAIATIKGRVLDVGCGAGRHAVYLQSNGLAVVGIDESSIAIDVAKSRGLHDARVNRIDQLTEADGPFDAILLLGNNLGILRDAGTAQSILKKLHTISSPGAIILGESVNIATTTTQSHLDYQRGNIAQGRMPGQIKMRIRCRDLATDWFDYLLLSPSELEPIAAAAGWALEEIFDGGYRYIAKLRRCD